MSGSGAEKRSQAKAIRAAKLYSDGVSLSEIASLIGIDKAKVKPRIELGQRLMTLEKSDG